MKKYYSNNSGATLVMVLIVAVVLSVLGLALITISVSETKFAKKQEEIQQSNYVSMSAANAFASYIKNWPVPLETDELDAREELIERIMNNLNSTSAPASGWHTMTSGIIDETFEYKLQLNKVSGTESDVRVTAIGKYRDITRNITFLLSEMRYFDTAIFSFTDINLNNSAVANGNGAPFVAGGIAYNNNTAQYIGDIFDSRPETGDPTPFVNAYTNVFKPAPSSSYYSYPSGLKLNDDPADDVNDADYVFDDGLEINYNDLSTAYEFTRIVGSSSLPAKGINFGEVDFGTQVNVDVVNESDDDLFLMFDSLIIPNQSSITIDAPNEGRVFVLINGPDLGTIGSTNYGALRVDGEIQATSATRMGNFIVYASDNVNRIILKTSSNPDQNAMIIAPYSEVVIRNSNEYIGSIIANKVVLENSTIMSYPNFDGLFGEELGLPSLGYSISDWKRP